MNKKQAKFRTLHAKQLEFLRNIRADYKQSEEAYKKYIGRCGRRWGKTAVWEETLTSLAMGGAKIGWFVPQFNLLLPSYARAVNIGKDLIASKNKDKFIHFQPVNGNSEGGLIEFWSLENEDAGRSREYDLALIDEAGLVQKGLRDIYEQAIEPTLLSRLGKTPWSGMAIMVGTPKGISHENFFYQASNDATLGWKGWHYPTSSNPMYRAEDIEAIRRSNAPLVFQQEYLAEFVDFSGTAFFSPQSFLVNGEPVDYPQYVQTVFAVIDTAVKTGRENDGTAVTYYAHDPYQTHYPWKMTVLDWDYVQIEGSLLETWLPGVFRRLDELAKETRALMPPLGTWIEDKASGTILLQQAQRREWPAHPIDSKLTSVGKDERAISVSGYVYQGKVKISKHAYQKQITYKQNTRNHWWTQATQFRIGVKDQEDDLLDTLTYGVSIGLGNSDGY